MLKRMLYSLHRILGTLLSILFLIWFLSGFVMIYHTFPKVSNTDKYANMDIVSNVTFSIDSILNRNLFEKPIERLVLKSFGGHSYYEVVTEKSDYKFSAKTGNQISDKPTYEQIETYAKKWNDAAIEKVDTLRELEQWIPFGKLRNEFPIYKFYFGDDQKHQLYISSLTGEALQYTNADNRFWSWMGAIPHWVYFTKLRQDSQLWINVVICLSGLGSIMCIAGIIIGIRTYINQRIRKKNWKTPYRKFSYKWHHILGFIFGVFVFTFVFSGMMSLASVPQWILKIHKPDISKNININRPLSLSDYKLDCEVILNQYERQVKSIEWSSFGDVPVYNVIIDNELQVFDASENKVKPLAVTEQMINNRLSKNHHEAISINKIEEYDNYYVRVRTPLPLPVYKVNIADEDNSTYYINPQNGDIKYFNTNTKLRRWTYQALHSWELGFLVKRPILWNIIMWITMIGGTLVSLTGVWLTFKYIRRKIKKLKRYLCSKTKENDKK